MIYGLNKSIQRVLSRFWGHHIAHMEIVYVVTLLYMVLITGLILGNTYFSLENFLEENAMFCSYVLSSLKKLG